MADQGRVLYLEFFSAFVGGLEDELTIFQLQIRRSSRWQHCYALCLQRPLPDALVSLLQVAEE